MHRNLPEYHDFKARPALAIVSEAQNMTCEVETGHPLRMLAEDLESASAVCRDIGRVEAAVSLARAARKLAIVASRSGKAPEIAPKRM